jgi:toxin-antitoxin system PIN domain toxin
MTPCLLDINVLVALFWPTHAQHEVVLKWFAEHRYRGWATCPLTEVGFVRVVSNPVFSRDAVTPKEALGVLAANTVASDHVFWSGDLSLTRAMQFAGPRLVGHQQVVYAYLIALAVKYSGFLVTFEGHIRSLVELNSAEFHAIQVIE